MSAVVSSPVFKRSVTFEDRAPIQKMVYLHPDDIAPTWKLLLQKITEIALQILVPFGLILIFAVILPVKFSAILLPYISFGLVFSFSLMFASHKAQLEAIPESQLFAPPELREPLPLDAPIGMVNIFANCWVNSLTHMIRTDEKLVAWIRGSPSCLNHPNFNLVSFMPISLLYTAEQRAAYSISSPICPKLESVAIAEVIKWIYDVPEMDLIRVRSIFNDTPFDSVIPPRILANLPEGERAISKRNAMEAVFQLRNYAENLALTEADKEDLAENILNYVEGLRLIKNFYPMMRAGYTTASVNAILNPEEPIGNHGRIVERGRELLALHPHLKSILLTAKLVSEKGENEKLNLLKYISVIRKLDLDCRMDAMRFLSVYKRFFISYDQAMHHENDEVQWTSQTLRSVFATLSRGVITNNWAQQCDPTEAFSFLLGLLPPEMIVEREVRRLYDTRGLPPILGKPDGIQRHVESNQGLITLEITSRARGIQEMINQYSDKAAGDDENNLRQESIDGIERVYPLLREQHQFVTAPPSLWLVVKRYNFEQPWDLFNFIVPCSFPKPPFRTVKIDCPINLDEIISINTIEDEIIQYKLDSFTVHLGKTSNSGHYIAYERRSSIEGDVWYELNDAIVRKIEPDELTKAARQAYFIHYSRI